MGKAPCCSKVGLHKGPWSTKEDMILTNYIQTHGEGLWRSLPKNAGLLRCGKSCRLRWMNYLRPGIKRGNISADEEDLIIRLHKLLGNRWALIAGRLPGRTDNEIKNYWNTHLSKKLKNPGMDFKESKVVSKKGKNNGSKERGSKNMIQKDLKTENEESKCNEDIKKVEVFVPKPIRVFSGSSSNATIETHLSSSSSHGVNRELKGEMTTSPSNSTSSVETMDTHLSSSSSHEANGEVKVETMTLPSNLNSDEDIPGKICPFPDLELWGFGDVNFDQICSEGDDQVLIDGFHFLHEDLTMPTFNNMIEIVYDEYEQLL